MTRTLIALSLLALGGCGGDPPPAQDERRMVRVRPEADSRSPVVAPPAVAPAVAPPAPAPPLQLPLPPRPATLTPGALPDFAALYAATAPSVVALEVRARGADRQGTGFFVSSDGRMLTSAHVVEDATTIIAVTRDGRLLPATVVGVDLSTDLALLAVEGDDLPPPLPLATRDAQVGEWVLVIGTPLGLAFSATRGIVSATGRSEAVWGSAGYADLIQTDAAINRGNSGGPLLGLEGSVLGIAAAIDPEADRISFAIPATMARIVALRLNEER